MFTSKWCKNCPQAEEALNAILADLGPDGISIIAYHGFFASDDPLATDETLARIEWYESDPDFPVIPGAFPTVTFDGIRFVQGAQTSEIAETNYWIEINNRKDVGSPLSIEVSGSMDAGGGEVTATVAVRDQLGGGNLVLQLVVIEDHVEHWSPRTSIFDFVARDILDPEALSLEAVGDSVSVERDFTIDDEWVIEHLDVIAFVQDSETKEVIQSGRLGGNR
jgi:hypothetical protein